MACKWGDGYKDKTLLVGTPGCKWGDGYKDKTLLVGTPGCKWGDGYKEKTLLVGAPGCKWGDSSKEKTLLVEVPKKDTEIDCYDKSAIVNEEIELEAFLKEAGTLGAGLINALVKFYIDDNYVGEDYTNNSGAPWPHEHGMARVPYKPTASGTFTIKAVFEGAGDYNGSEDTGTLTVIECEKGIKVTVKDIPPEGLTVELRYSAFLEGEETVDPSNPVAMFTGLVVGRAYFIRVKNIAGDIMYESEAITVPSTGCVSITVYGYLGCSYRTWLGVSPRTPAPGKSFTLTAHLIKNPKETVGEGYEVKFYEVVNKREEEIGTNLTNESGIATFMTSKTEAGTYTYVARYSGADTFAESITVTVSAVPPCPIEEAFREVCPVTTAYGCVVHPDLVTLRAFRDAVLPRFVVKAYYAMGPFIIIFFVNNRVSKWFVRKMVHIVARRLRKRWGY